MADQPPSARYDLSPYLAAPIEINVLMRELAAAPERHGSFTEERRFAALDRPLTAHGELEYRRPGHMEKRTLGPVAETLVVDGDRLTVSNAGGGERVLQLGSEPALRGLVDSVLGVLSGNLAALQRHYRVSAEGTTKAWRLTLQPADPVVAQFVAVVRIDGTGSTPLVFETIQTNGDSQRMTVAPAGDPAR